jgi:hypothetical protein
MRFLKLGALILGGLILVPSGAHLLETSHKFGMDHDTYFAVQRIYAGWALSGIAIFGAVVVDVVLFLHMRARDRSAALLALAAATQIGLGLIVFFTWVYPANVATANWTALSADWEPLRQQWEYGHAAIAILTLGAFIAISVSVVRSSDTSR